jgi:hypothetical protein
MFGVRSILVIMTFVVAHKYEKEILIINVKRRILFYRNILTYNADVRAIEAKL